MRKATFEKFTLQVPGHTVVSQKQRAVIVLNIALLSLTTDKCTVRNVAMNIQYGVGSPDTATW